MTLVRLIKVERSLDTRIAAVRLFLAERARGSVYSRRIEGDDPQEDRYDKERHDRRLAWQSDAVLSLAGEHVTEAGSLLHMARWREAGERGPMPERLLTDEERLTHHIPGWS